MERGEGLTRWPETRSALGISPLLCSRGQLSRAKARDNGPADTSRIRVGRWGGGNSGPLVWWNCASGDTKTLRFIAQSDLRVLDPISTTAYITRITATWCLAPLFAIDAEFAPHPQTAGEYSVSPDKLTYRFQLRHGLGFHDGSPVRGIDCVAPVRRWMARDGHRQALAGVLDAITPDGDEGFTIKLKQQEPGRQSDTDPGAAVTRAREVSFVEGFGRRQ